MRQRLLLAGIVAALFLSGWGGALAAAFCAHDGHPSGAASSCCRRRGAGEDRSRQAGAEHEGHPQAGATAEHCDRSARAEEDGAAASADDVRGAGSPARQKGFCVHCVGRSENPPASSDLPQSSQLKRSQGQHAAVSQKLLSPDTGLFARAVIPKQGSPPESAQRRHLLLSVFLI